MSAEWAMRFLMASALGLVCVAATGASTRAIAQGSSAVHATHDVPLRQGLGSPTRSVQEVASGVWALLGYSVVNIYAIRGKDGLIIVDTGISAAEAREAFARLRERTSLPVKAIVYTHKHYMAGAGVFAEGRPVTVVGHPSDAGGKLSVLRGAFPETLPVQFARGIQQMGGLLPAKGPDAAAGGHVATADRQSVPLAVNLTATDGLQTTLAGIKVQFFSANASDDDSVTIWLPDRRIVINNFYWPVAANLYAPRGDAFRDVRSWIAGIKVVQNLRPVLMLSTHAEPVSGEQAIQEVLGHYSRYHQILLDQTLRGILKGVGPGDIRDFVKLPKAYEDVRAGYGDTPNWYPQSIYAQAFGWYSGDAADLLPVSAAFRNRELTRLLGGTQAVLELARSAEAKGQIAWALELTNHAFLADPGNVQARAMKAALLRKQAQRTPASIAYNFYLSQARALEGTGAAPLRFYDANALNLAPACELIDQYRVRIVPDRTNGLDGLIAFDVGGVPRCGLHVRDGLAEFVADVGTGKQAPVATATLSRQRLTDLFVGKTPLDRLFDDPDVPVAGDRARAVRLGAAFELLPSGGVLNETFVDGESR